VGIPEDSTGLQGTLEDSREFHGTPRDSMRLQGIPRDSKGSEFAVSPLGYVGTALLLYSFPLQAIYRYIIVVYPTRTSWQSSRVQGMLICVFLDILYYLTSAMVIYVCDDLQWIISNNLEKENLERK
jgi:hypothetical protein